MPSKLDLSEDSKVSLPAKNLITIIGGILIGAWFAFGVIERLKDVLVCVKLDEVVVRKNPPTSAFVNFNCLT